MKIKTENKSSQTALRCTRMRLQQTLVGVRLIALEGALDRTAEVRRLNAGQKFRSQQLVVCSTANDRTQAVIDRSYRRGTCRTKRELEREIKLQKFENKEKQKQKKSS